MIKSTPAKITNEISDGLLTPSPDIHDGEILEQRGKLDEALVVYRRCIEPCNAKIASSPMGSPITARPMTEIRPSKRSAVGR